MAVSKITAKQEAFSLAYVETGNASEAYRRAPAFFAAAVMTVVVLVVWL